MGRPGLSQISSETDRGRTTVGGLWPSSDSVRADANVKFLRRFACLFFNTGATGASKFPHLVDTWSARVPKIHRCPRFISRVITVMRTWIAFVECNLQKKQRD